MEMVEPQAAIYEGLTILALGVGPALLGAFVGALVVSIATAGLEFNVDQVAPKLERLDPMAGLKRIFSLKQAAEVGKGLMIASLMAWVVWSAVEDGATTALRSVTVEGVAAFSALLSLLLPTVKRALAILLVLGLADYALARRRHVRDLMMSKQDVKTEHKQSEGDPHQKSKRKAIHRQLAAGGGGTWGAKGHGRSRQPDSHCRRTPIRRRRV